MKAVLQVNKARPDMIPNVIKRISLSSYVSMSCSSKLRVECSDSKGSKTVENSSMMSSTVNLKSNRSHEIEVMIVRSW